MMDKCGVQSLLPAPFMEFSHRASDHINQQDEIPQTFGSHYYPKQHTTGSLWAQGDDCLHISGIEGTFLVSQSDTAKLEHFLPRHPV